MYARLPRLQAIMAGLPGPRTAKDIDGEHIRHVVQTVFGYC